MVYNERSLKFQSLPYHSQRGQGRTSYAKRIDGYLIAADVFKNSCAMTQLSFWLAQSWFVLLARRNDPCQALLIDSIQPILITRNGCTLVAPVARWRIRSLEPLCICVLPITTAISQLEWSSLFAIVELQVVIVQARYQTKVRWSLRTFTFMFRIENRLFAARCSFLCAVGLLPAFSFGQAQKSSLIWCIFCNLIGK